MIDLTFPAVSIHAVFQEHSKSAFSNVLLLWKLYINNSSKVKQCRLTAALCVCVCMRASVCVGGTLHIGRRVTDSAFGFVTRPPSHRCCCLWHL